MSPSVYARSHLLIPSSISMALMLSREEAAAQRARDSLFGPGTPQQGSSSSSSSSAVVPPAPLQESAPAHPVSSESASKEPPPVEPGKKKSKRTFASVTKVDGGDNPISPRLFHSDVNGHRVVYVFASFSLYRS